MLVHHDRFAEVGLRGKKVDRRALTVVEILIAAALALVVIAAMVRLFANVGGAVSKARATLDMSGQLRMASNRLRRDLDGLTVPVRPWPSPADGAGYFEYVEADLNGPGRLVAGLVAPFASASAPQLRFSRDNDADGDGTIDIVEDENSNTTFDYLEGRADTSFGDVDDILMFTSSSPGQPFVGKVRGTVRPLNGRFYVDATSSTLTSIESPTAEIVWWLRGHDFDDEAVDNDLWDQGERISFTLYRRQLLVRPDFNRPLDLDGDMVDDDLNDDSVVDGRDVAMTFISGASVNDLAPLLRAFYDQNDVSVRHHRVTKGTTEYIIFTANSLEDLTARENRFAHLPIIVESTLGSGTAGPYSFATAAAFPFPVDLNPLSLTSLPRIAKAGEELLRLPRVGPNLNQMGEDVILSNVRAFDVQVFDPTADVQVDSATNPNVPLTPGDPRWGAAGNTSIGQGAFVDLNYSTALSPTTAFSPVPQDASGLGTTGPNLQMPTYCTWSSHYEADGVDQDGDTDFDEGTDGIDNDSVNGVDDPGERETSPPYPFPLRGIKVTFRVIEIDTQQVRQTSVVSNFVPE